MSGQFINCDVFRTIPLGAVLSHSTKDSNKVAFLSFDVFDAGLEIDELYRRRVVGT